VQIAIRSSHDCVAIFSDHCDLLNAFEVVFIVFELRSVCDPNCWSGWAFIINSLYLILATMSLELW
jgi:hypothetical protein